MILAICDDDKSYTKYLASLCRPLPFVETLFLYADADQLLSDVRSGSRIDAVLMDIELECKQTGIDYMADLYALNPKIRVIYVTGYVERFVERAFLKPSLLSGFIQKPVQEDFLFSTLKKVQRELDADKQLLLVFSKKQTDTISCDSIFCLESSAHTIHIYTESGTISIYGKLSSLAGQLPSSFLQCHKSYIVNMDKIRRIEKRQITLQNNKGIPISKSFQSKVKSTYFSYMQNKICR